MSTMFYQIGLVQLTKCRRIIATNQSLRKIGVRWIASRNTMLSKPPLPKKPPPFPYKTNRYLWLRAWLFDDTLKRLDENSRIVVVEGPVAAGKSKFAKQLADELDMSYYPEANQDMLYTNRYGFNLKQLDPQLPESCRTCDIDKFLKNPKHRSVAGFQIAQYTIKYSLYIDAVAEVLNTGKGVVLDRSPFSDFVFVEAMYQQGYLSKEVYDIYYNIRKTTLRKLWKPHLIVYLDVPVNKVLENIKNRNISYEVNSPVLNSKYLSKMEEIYKQKYLTEMQKDTKFLIYDWSHGGDMDVVIEDIEKIDFSERDYVETHDRFLTNVRYWHTNRFTRQLAVLPYGYHKAEELTIPWDDAVQMKQIYDSAPGEQYAYGYNVNMGDSSVLFKLKYYRHTVPLIERSIPE